MLDTAIKIENLKKQYTLGAIGGRTLNAELQSWWARKRGKADPNWKLGQDYADFGESFYALDGINLEIKKGEAVGIIGGNGAGKSTLLKILSRVTAPTEGDVWINGRISSMLEVGTGFHGELTGRENIYMNGAILGMTKKEVDQKMESIIDFSECRQFIDTPVKRYSSGMYVKLAFAVASHLDAEIMIMDEVLAVGDMAFQKKCLGKMGEEAHDGKTVLYVSHNMATIRKLCSRCIVLDKGRVIYDGDVNKAVSIYMKEGMGQFPSVYNVENLKRDAFHLGRKVKIKKIKFMDKGIPAYFEGEKVRLEVKWITLEDVEDVLLRVALKCPGGINIGMSESNRMMPLKKGEEYRQVFEFDSSIICAGVYYFKLFLSQKDTLGNMYDLDGAMAEIKFAVVENEQEKTVWKQSYWGNVILPKLRMVGDK